MLWNPPESPLAIEFPPELVAQVVQLGGLQGTRGILYGQRNGNVVQVLAARRKRSPGPVGMESVGVFAMRTRGDVFMTDGDLKWFGENDASAALVVAGDRAGFFVRGFDGKLQSIRSYQEITTVPAAPRKPPMKRIRRVTVSGTALAAWGFLLLEVLLVEAFVARLIPRPGGTLAVTEQEGQLLITWNRAAGAEGGRIEITDGGLHKIFTVQEGQSSATYAPSSRNVQIRLSPPERLLFGKTDLVRFAAIDR